ncbi:olfactory receptor class A-like protein 1 [Erpetoichthys calabaricus]|uniref:olfactory receptor class A-like protein 1 n=1 Tax=Erpetoichthys calabaricus TaxID=27687 RepID=UPI002234D389|nr:olfactory receptor class A-like protein 1 [Erpetoichthys calabaricus]
MDTRSIIKASAFLILTLISTPSNLAICCAFLDMLLTDGKLMATDIILFHLALSNLMVALSRSVPQTLTAFGCTNLFDDLGCKVIVFCFRLYRGLSISLTCLLSVYQAVIISPAITKLAMLKNGLSRSLVPLIIFLYVFCGSTNVYPILYAVSKLINNTVPPYTFNLEFCFIPYPDGASYVSAGLINFFRDFLFILLMAIMSVYILILLYQHGKKVKSIRSSDRGHSEARPETKASRAVVTLVILYVIFFGVDNVIWLYSLSVFRVATLINDIRVFFATLYTSVCPVVVIATNPKVKAKLKEFSLKRLPNSVKTINPTV